MRVTKLKTIIAAISATLLFGGSSALAQWQSEIRDALPDGGEMHLALYNDGARDGFMRLGWQKMGTDTLFLYDRSMLPSGELYETQEAKIDAATLFPKWSKVRLHQGATIGYVDASFKKAKATGKRRSVRPGNDDIVREISHEALPADLTMRMTTFVLPLALSQEEGAAVSYHWYSPLSDQIAPVTLTARERANVETPAGSFEAVRFELRGAQPENDIYVSVGDAPQIVRIDVLGQPFQFLALPEQER